MVGDQLHAVTHRHPHATIHLVVGGVRRKTEQPAKGATDEILGCGHTNRGYAGGGFPSSTASMTFDISQVTASVAVAPSTPHTPTSRS